MRGRCPVSMYLGRWQPLAPVLFEAFPAIVWPSVPIAGRNRPCRWSDGAPATPCGGAAGADFVYAHKAPGSPGAPGFPGMQGRPGIRRGGVPCRRCERVSALFRKGAGRFRLVRV